MLEELRIAGLGVIDEAVLPLGPGLTVVTGETGAGKTMVVTSLMLLFGARADAARVRTGTAQASVDGRLVVDPAGPAARRVLDAGGTVEGAAAETGVGSAGELVLRRVVAAGGRSRAYAGGAAVPVTVLGELAEHLVAVHGQSDQQRLVRPAAQRAALDRFAGVDLTACAAAYHAWRAAEAALADRVSRAAELRREADLLAHGVAEIETVAPEPGELDELTRTAARLGHAESLTAAARTAHDLLLGAADDPLPDAADVLGLLGTAARTLGQQQGDDDELAALAARVDELAALAAEVGADLGAYAAGLDADPAQLERVEARRAALTALLRKYCEEPEPNLAAVLRWADAARGRLGEIDVSDEAIAALRRGRDAAAREAADRAAEVSARRRAAARELGAAVTAELAGLAMPQAAVEIAVRPRPATRGAPQLTLELDGSAVAVAAGPEGFDEIEFLLQPHPGAPPLPIGRGASGGELSRVMLALEVCLVGSDGVPTLVFDEVDAGVGGRAAVEVGRRLAGLARNRQVFVVTHLAQVAAYADRHVVVDKPLEVTGEDPTGITTSDVRLVAEDDRIRELARMLAGSDTDTARDHAAELLREASADRAAAARPVRTPPPPRASRPAARRSPKAPTKPVRTRTN